MATRIRVPRSAPASRRKLVWARKRAAQVFTAGTTLFKVNLLEDFEAAYGANLIGATVTRIRGAAVADMDGAANVVLAARIGQESEVDAPPTPGSGPIDEPFADWMMWEPFLSVAGETPGTPAHGRVIDVKSQRRLEEIDEELSMWTSSATTGTVIWDLSILLKLP